MTRSNVLTRRSLDILRFGEAPISNDWHQNRQTWEITTVADQGIFVDLVV